MQVFNSEHHVRNTAKETTVLAKMTIIFKNYDMDKERLCEKSQGFCKYICEWLNIKTCTDGWTDQSKLSPQTCSTQTCSPQFSRLQRTEGFGLLVGNEFVHYANVNEYKT